MKKQFRTNYAAPLMKSDIGKCIKMTVPGLALTNGEHIKKAKLGIPEKAIKVIFDPQDLYPDVRAMDLVDRHMLMKQAREVVQEIRTKKTEFEREQAEKKKQQKIELEKALDERIEKISRNAKQNESL